MRAAHKKLVRIAAEAIDSVFADASVPPSQTLADLEELADVIRVKIEALKSQSSFSEKGEVG